MSFQTPARTSQAITLIRPLLILLMMLAHLRALNSVRVMNEALSLNFDNWMTVFLESALAKSGVPLLSLISGYLAVYSLRRYGYFRLLLRKAKRLVWPLIWANLLFIVLITYPTQAADPSHRADLLIHPFDWFGWFQATFVFFLLPAKQPMYILKDLYTCFQFITQLSSVAKKRYVNLMVVLWMAWKCIYLDAVFLFPVYPLWFLRHDIVFAFYVGILLFLNSRDLVIDSRRVNLALVSLFPVICGAAAAIYVVNAKPDHVTLFLWLDFSVKLVSVVGCVALMSLLVQTDSPVSRALRWLSPYSYSLFLTHVFSFTFFDRAFQHLFGRPEFFDLSGTAYLLGIFITAVVVAVLLRMAWGQVAQRLPGNFAGKA